MIPPKWQPLQVNQRKAVRLSVGCGSFAMGMPTDAK